MAKERLGEAFVEVTVTGDKLDAGLTKAEKKTEKSVKTMEKSWGGLSKSIKGAATAMGIYAAAAAASKFNTFVRDAVAAGDAVSKMSSKLGISTDFVQNAGFAAERSGVQFATLSMAMQRYTRRAAEANKGTGEAKNAVKELGLKLQDTGGKLKSTETLFREAMKALSGVENAADRVRLAMKLFDSEGVALVNMAENFQALTKEAELLGIALDEATIQKAVQAAEELTKLDAAWAKLSNTIAINAAPALTGAVNSTTSVMDTFFDWMAPKIEGLAFMWKAMAGPIEDTAELVTDAMRAAAASGGTAKKSDPFGFLRTPSEDDKHRRRREVVESSKQLRRQISDLETFQKEQDRIRQEAQAKSIKALEEQGKKAKEVWTTYTEGMSAAMADMVIKADFSFTELGELFARNFIERSVQKGFDYIFEAMAQLIGGAFSSSFSGFSRGGGTVGVPMKTPGGFDSGAVTARPRTPMGGGAVAGAPIINVHDEVGVNVEARTGSRGEIEMWISGVIAKDFANGGPARRMLQNVAPFRPVGRS